MGKNSRTYIAWVFELFEEFREFWHDAATFFAHLIQILRVFQHNLPPSDNFSDNLEFNICISSFFVEELKLVVQQLKYPTCGRQSNESIWRMFGKNLL